MQKEWSLPEILIDKPYQSLKEELRVSDTVARLLWRKNIRTYDAARKFFAPVWEDMHDPFLMDDMEKAVESIAFHQSKGHKIMIYGDYDVDGTTSVALMHLFFAQYYPNTINYVPDRYSEGYGLSEKGIRTAANENCKLIIALDCGIKANDKALIAK
jgi:single-stranded-DNA-specific exonuclease